MSTKVTLDVVKEILASNADDDLKTIYEQIGMVELVLFSFTQLKEDLLIQASQKVD